MRNEKGVLKLRRFDRKTVAGPRALIFSCGFEADRDLNAAYIILVRVLTVVGAVHSDSMPAEAALSDSYYSCYLCYLCYFESDTTAFSSMILR